MATWWQFIQGFFLYVGWWLIPIISLFLYKRRLSAYPIDVVIYEKRGKDLIKTNDVAGRFTDPINEYKLKMSKDTIPIPKYDWVLQCAHKPTNLFEKFVNLLSGKIGSITLFKYGSKQYKPVEVKVNGELKTELRPIKDEHGQDVYVNVYVPIHPKKAMSNLEFEVIDWDDINHMTQELRAIATRRSPIQSFLEKYGGHIGIIIAFIALLIGGYYFKEMIINAPVCQAGTSSSTPATTPEKATVPNIPVISNLIPPPGT